MIKIPSILEQLTVFIKDPFKTNKNLRNKYDYVCETIVKNPGILRKHLREKCEISDYTLFTYHERLRNDGFIITTGTTYQYFPPKEQDD